MNSNMGGMLMNSNTLGSSSSVPYSDFHSSHLHQSAPDFSGPTPMQQNPVMQQQQMYQNQWPAWQNQMQGFSNALPSSNIMPNANMYMGQNNIVPGFQNMGSFNSGSGYLHLLQDAMRLSTPVGSVANDRALLVEALCQSRRDGTTYRHALDGLHGKNNHASSLWKDYYLEYKDEIDQLIATQFSSTTTQKHAINGHKKELTRSSSLQKKERPTASPVPLPASAPPRKRSYVRSTSPPLPTQRQPPGRRHTINSLTALSPVFNEKLLPPANQIPIPEPPSRSPTPPTKVVPGTKGNRYTEEDKAYFFKFITWRLKGNPGLTKNELCQELAQKAPHHTAMSWMSHWAARHEIADRILAAAQHNDDEDSDSEQEEQTDTQEKIIRRPNYYESSESDFDDEESSESNSAPDDGDGEFKARRSSKQSNSKGRPQTFTEEDLRLVARHVASQPDWANLTTTERWRTFAEQNPKRSSAAWAEHYRSRADAIDKLAAQYQRQAVASSQGSGIQTQCGRPSWANKGEDKRKRRYSTESGDEEESEPSKRGREE